MYLKWLFIKLGWLSWISAEWTLYMYITFEFGSHKRGELDYQEKNLRGRGR